MVCRKKDVELLKEYKMIINGICIIASEDRVAEPKRRIRVIHHCKFPGSECNCTDFEHSKRRGKNAISSTHYRRRPKAPQVDDWTKLRAFEFLM